jgi:class 3 adenylate cyclase
VQHARNSNPFSSKLQPSRDARGTLAQVTNPPHEESGSSAATVDEMVLETERLLHRGEPLLAYNTAQTGLGRWPEHVRLAQLQALSLARSGDTERANQVLDDLAARGLDDAETLGMLARTHKDLALREADGSRRSLRLKAGFDLYERAYHGASASRALGDAYYTGINAATMAALLDDKARAAALARETIELCRLASAGPESEQACYWRLATQGEAKLILGLEQEAARDYALAAQCAGKRYGDLSTTRRQAALLCRHLAIDASWLDQVLAIPEVLVFTGHMIDRPDRPRPRFPSMLEPFVRDAIAARLDALKPMAAYGSAACGADILCLEEVQRLGGETHVILPFPQPEFRKVSVEFAEGDWSSRFERVLAGADSVTVTSDHHARESSAPFEYANLVLTGMGRLRAQVLDTRMRGLAIVQPESVAVPGGAVSVLGLWHKLAIAIEYVPLSGSGAATGASDASTNGIAASLSGAASANGIAAGTPAVTLDPAEPAFTPQHGQSHAIRSLMFVDVVGYTQLSEDHIPNYVSGFLGAVAGLNRRTTHCFEHIESSGDGFYAVFTDAVDAGLYALELIELVRSTDWSRHGLPENFNVRIALHCGPVYCGRDPITGNPIYTGPHTSRAARIEPITPPGQVYASSAFAAVAAAGGVDGLDMRYIGNIPLAKDYGSLGLYHILPGR